MKGGKYWKLIPKKGGALEWETQEDENVKNYLQSRMDAAHKAEEQRKEKAQASSFETFESVQC